MWDLHKEQIQEAALIITKLKIVSFAFSINTAGTKQLMPIILDWLLVFRVNNIRKLLKSSSEFRKMHWQYFFFAGRLVALDWGYWLLFGGVCCFVLLFWVLFSEERLDNSNKFPEQNWQLYQSYTESNEGPSLFLLVQKKK